MIEADRVVALSKAVLSLYVAPADMVGWCVCHRSSKTLKKLARGTMLKMTLRLPLQMTANMQNSTRAYVVMRQKLYHGGGAVDWCWVSWHFGLFQVTMVRVAREAKPIRLATVLWGRSSEYSHPTNSEQPLITYARQTKQGKFMKLLRQKSIATLAIFKSEIQVPGLK